MRQLGLVDAPPEEEFDNPTSLAAELLRVPIAHVSILDREKRRIFYKSQQGHPDALAKNRKLPMELTYCQHVALTQAPVIVVDASTHPLIQGTPAHGEGKPLAYMGLPISAPDGHVLGGLCLMQPETREWTEGEIASAKKLAACVSDLIRLKAAMLTSEQLRQEQRQFTYAISHDLMSPANTLQLILEEVAFEGDKLSDDTRQFVADGQGTIMRMKQQVEDVLKYSRSIDMGDSVATISLAALVEDILGDLKSEITAARASIHCGDLPELVGNPIDVILLDINTPRMNGFEFLEQASIDIGSEFSTSVVIMLTTSLDPEDEKRAEEYQAVKGYLNKPLSKEGLVTISRLIPGEKGDGSYRTLL